MKNNSLLVATPDGIFYVAEDWRTPPQDACHLSLLSFDPEVSFKYQSYPSLLQIKECTAWRTQIGIHVDIRSLLEHAKYYLRGDVLLIEMTDVILLVQYEFNTKIDRPQGLKQVIVTVLLKEDCHNFCMLSEKKCLLLYHRACELMLGRYHESSRNAQNMMIGEMAKNRIIHPEKTWIVQTTKVKSSITSITNISKFPTKHLEWDYAISIAGDREDYIGLLQDGARVYLSEVVKTGSKTRFSLMRNLPLDEKITSDNQAQAYTIICLSEGKGPIYLRSSRKLGVEETHPDEDMLTSYDPNDYIVGLMKIPHKRLFVQVGLKNMLLRCFDGDLTIELPKQSIRAQILQDFLFLLDESLTLKVLRLDRSPETSTLSSEEVVEVPKWFSQGVTAFHVDKDLLTMTTSKGVLVVFKLFLSNNTILFKEVFRSQCNNGAAVLQSVTKSSRTQFKTSNSKMVEEGLPEQMQVESEMDVEPLPQDQEWTSISDPTWRLSFPPVVYSSYIIVTDLFHIQFGGLNSPIFLFIRLSTNDLLVYKSIGLNNREEIISFKRLVFSTSLPTSVNDNIELEQQLKSTKQDKESAAAIISKLLQSTYLDVATAGSDSRIIISAPSLKTLLYSHLNGELSVHMIRSASDSSVILHERVCSTGSNSVLFWDSRGYRVAEFSVPLDTALLDLGVSVLLRKYKEKEPIIRLAIVEKDKLAGVVVVTKSRQDSFGYSMALFDVTSRDWTDQIKFQPSDRLTGIKKLNMENASYQPEEVLCVMMITIQENHYGARFQPKCHFYKLSKSKGIKEGTRLLKFDKPEEQNAGDTPNQLLTAVFNIQQTFFMVFESKIIQLKRHSDTYHEDQRYETNANCIIDVHVIKDKYVLMTNMRGSVLFFLWDNEKTRLKKRSEYNLGNIALTEGRFLDEELLKVSNPILSQIVVTDQKKSLNIMTLKKPTTSNETDDMYTIQKQQRIKLSARAFSMDLKREDNGRVLARANGGLDSISSKKVRESVLDKLFQLHKNIMLELPFFSGLPPVSQLNYNATKGSSQLTQIPSSSMRQKSTSTVCL